MIRIAKTNHNVYGQRKLCVAVNREGIPCCVNTVSADCKKLNLKSCTRTKYRVKTTDSDHDQPIAQNLLSRDFTASRPCEKWVTDITYIETVAGWLYLVVILDLYTRRVIGWATSDSLATEFVVDALKMAIRNSWSMTGEILLHSDRGVQYTSKDFRACLKLADITQSMSRRANCWDNAPSESFFAKLKQEWVYVKDVYVDHVAAERDIFEYIECFYNRQRLHQALGYRTPMEVEAEFFAKKALDADVKSA